MTGSETVSKDELQYWFMIADTGHSSHSISTAISLSISRALLNYIPCLSMVSFAAMARSDISKSWPR
jgi:hypothetical protein